MYGFSIVMCKYVGTWLEFSNNVSSLNVFTNTSKLHFLLLVSGDMSKHLPLEMWR